MLDHKIFSLSKTSWLVDDKFVDGDLAYIMDLSGKG